MRISDLSRDEVLAVLTILAREKCDLEIRFAKRDIANWKFERDRCLSFKATSPDWRRIWKPDHDRAVRKLRQAKERLKRWQDRKRGMASR